MLKTLLIRNVALIEDIEVEFESGFNIITGETGAGKSILIGALGLVLGERATQDTIRHGAEKALVEGRFSSGDGKALRNLFANLNLDWGAEIIVRRELTAKGQSRCFVNDTPVSLAQLKQVGEFLVDLHGQHEHQSLLRKDTHLTLLDDFAGTSGILAEYQIAYETLLSIFAQVEHLRSKEKELKEKKDFFEFQMREIDAVNPQTGEEEALEAEIRILENAERLFQTTSTLYSSLYDNETSVYGSLVVARNQLERAAEIDPVFKEALKECVSAVEIVNELSKFLQNYSTKIEFNNERLEEIRERLGKISLLKKKYGGSLQSLLDHRASIGREYLLAENYEQEIGRLEERIEEVRRQCSSAARRLSEKRGEYGSRICSMIEDELKTLGMPNAKMEVRINTRPADGNGRVFVRMGNKAFAANPYGIDDVEFFISPNVGEDVKPLVRIASGGEVSRIMLALKTVLARSERLPLLIFDEIDVGVSGRVALAVGTSLKNLSQFHQVIAITHLPQIAGLADVHYVVEKLEGKKRTYTTLRKLPLEERVKEVAKLMSGAEVTEAGLDGARELMGLKKGKRA